MNNIALVGENELQRGLRASYENLMGVNGASVGVTATGNLAEVTNDKGLTVEKANTADAHGVTAGVRNQIGAPTVSGDRVGELLDNLEQALAFLQVEGDEKSTEVAIRRNEQSSKASAKKFAAQLETIRAQTNNLPDGADVGKIIGNVFKGIGVAISIAAAAAVSVASGGAASGMIAAAAIGLTSYIADVSGGYEAMQNGISKALQENNGYTKAEADRAAGFISLAIQLTVDIASIVAGSVSTPQQDMANFIDKAKDTGFLVGSNGDPSKYVVEAAEKAIKEINNGGRFAGKFTDATVLAKQGMAVAQVNKVSKIANAVNGIAQTIQQAAFQGVSIGKSYKLGQTDVAAVRAEADAEAVREILSECESDLEATFNRIARRQGKVEKILASRSESLEKINNEFGGLA